MGEFSSLILDTFVFLTKAFSMKPLFSPKQMENVFVFWQTASSSLFLEKCGEERKANEHARVSVSVTCDRQCCEMLLARATE